MNAVELSTVENVRRLLNGGKPVGTSAGSGSASASRGPAGSSDFLPLHPIQAQNGKKWGPEKPATASGGQAAKTTQGVAGKQVAASPPASGEAENPSLPGSNSCHQPASSGNQLPDDFVPNYDLPCNPELPGRFDDFADDALAWQRSNRGKPGRKPAFDERAKGKLVALLGIGLSLRQAAACLGVSHTTVQNLLKAEPQLAEEAENSHFEAQIEPLICIIRESKHSWRAATWLLRYLDQKNAQRQVQQHGG